MSETDLTRYFKILCLSWPKLPCYWTYRKCHLILKTEESGGSVKRDCYVSDFYSFWLKLSKFKFVFINVASLMTVFAKFYSRSMA